MRNFCFALAALWLGAAMLVASPRAQMTTLGAGKPVSAIDPATTAWVNQVITNGGTVSAGRQSTVDTLIKSLKSASVWNILDRLWLLAAENNISARTDLVGLTLATVTGSPTFTTDRGYTGTDTTNPATDYLATGFNPATATNYKQNAAHFSAWSVTNTVSAAGGAEVGNDTLTGGLYDTFTDGNIYARINDSVGSGSQGAPGTRIGHWIVNRSGASASAAYQNGSLFSSPNAASAAVLAQNFLILAGNSGAGAQQGNPNQVAMISMGGDLTSVSSGVTSFYNALRTYMTAVGVP